MHKKLKAALTKYGIKRQKMTRPDLIEGLIKRLHPQAGTRPLIRLGGAGDGGYLVPNDLDGLGGLYSPGVAGTSSFERDFADRGINCFLADYSVDGPAEENSRFFFVKKFLGSSTRENYLRLQDWIEMNTPNGSDLALQMDIEGAEYEVLLDTPRDVLARFRFMVIEFHRLDGMFCRNEFPYIDQVFTRILESFTVVHIHPNNCTEVTRYKTLEVPPVLEFTFHRNDRFRPIDAQLQFPHDLDELNVPSKPDIILPNAWYR